MLIGFDILDYFYSNEVCYVDEIDRISESTLFWSENGGWYYMPAQKDSADWNIARMVGCPCSAKKNINRVKAENSIFLVPENQYSYFSEYPRKGCLLYFFSDKHNKKKHEKVRSPYTIEAKQNQLFLIYNGTIVGYVKPIRESDNFVEVYIEIMPSHRGKGLGAALLNAAADYFVQHNKGMVYIVEDTNQASVSTVKRAGFMHAETIFTFQVIG